MPSRWGQGQATLPCEAPTLAVDKLNKNQFVEKDEFEAKHKELEGVVNPIIIKVYQAAADAPADSILDFFPVGLPISIVGYSGRTD